ncbi:MAG: hypothetical protein ABI612_13690 [Betaproteobacteria bacterium]
MAADGKKPRPDPQAIALQDLMKHAGFSDAEFGELREAQGNSDALVRTEVIATNAVKGLFDDGQRTSVHHIAQSRRFGEGAQCFLRTDSGQRR